MNKTTVSAFSTDCPKKAAYAPPSAVRMADRKARMIDVVGDEGSARSAGVESEKVAISVIIFRGCWRRA